VSEGIARDRFLLAGVGSAAGRLLALLAGKGAGHCSAWKSICIFPARLVTFSVHGFAFSHLRSWQPPQISRTRTPSSNLATLSISSNLGRCSNVNILSAVGQAKGRCSPEHRPFPWVTGDGITWTAPFGSSRKERGAANSKICCQKAGMKKATLLRWRCSLRFFTDTFG